MQCLTIARSKWSRRKLTLLSKAPYGLFLLVMACLVHAVIHVHNFIWHRSRQQGLPILAPMLTHPQQKKSPCIDRRRGTSHSTLLLFYTGCITAQSGEKLTSRRTPSTPIWSSRLYKNQGQLSRWTIHLHFCLRGNDRIEAANATVDTAIAKMSKDMTLDSSIPR